MSAAAALVLARAPGPDGPFEQLAARLDRTARERLADVLRARTERWAREVAGEQVSTQEVGGGPRAVADAVARAFERSGGPLLVAAVEAVRLAPVHARVAALDLAEGAQASIGTTHDGRWYLLGLAAPLPELFEIPGEDWDTPLRLARMLEAAAQARLEVGLLRMERALVTPEDADALLADPLLADEVRDVLLAVR